MELHISILITEKLKCKGLFQQLKLARKQLNWMTTLPQHTNGLFQYASLIHTYMIKNMIVHFVGSSS